MGFRRQHVAQVRMVPLNFPGGGFLEALRGALVGFQFWHKSSKQQLASRSWLLASTGYACFTAATGVDCGALAGFGAAPCDGWSGGLGLLPPSAFFGARIACRVLPSCRGRNSTMLFSSTSLMSRSRIWRPRLVRVISRPRKKIVALTLSPSCRKRSTWFFLVS